MLGSWQLNETVTSPFDEFLISILESHQISLNAFSIWQLVSYQETVIIADPTAPFPIIPSQTKNLPVLDPHYLSLSRLFCILTAPLPRVLHCRQISFKT